MTGGIGGVHYGAEKNFDISADLPQIAAHNVAVVCAGPKAILDPALTSQYLETQSIPVIGYRCDNLPLFYCRTSAYPVNARLEQVADIAHYLSIKWSMTLRGGVVVANPCPAEEALDPQELDTLIDKALQEATTQQIESQALTPFLLARMTELSNQRTLQANIALVYNNARLGSQLAMSYYTQHEH